MRLLNKIIFLLTSLVLFTGCDLYLAESDNTTYEQMLSYGINFLENNIGNSITVEDSGHSLSVKAVEIKNVDSKEWQLHDSVEIKGITYNSYISKNYKTVLLTNI